MKLEIRRRQNVDGKIFYQVWADDSLKETFYAGIIEDPMVTTNEFNAKELAKHLYNRIKEGAQTVVSIVQSEEI